jgi:hypothetical protein
VLCRCDGVRARRACASLGFGGWPVLTAPAALLLHSSASSPTERHTMYASRMRAGTQRALARMMFPSAASARSGSAASSAASSVRAASASIAAQGGAVAPLCSSFASIWSSSGGALGSARTFSSAAGDAAGAAGAGVAAASSDGSADGEEGRATAPVGSNGSSSPSASSSRGQQGAADDTAAGTDAEPQLTQEEKDERDGRVRRSPILDVDPYPPERVRTKTELHVHTNIGSQQMKSTVQGSNIPFPLVPPCFFCLLLDGCVGGSLQVGGLERDGAPFAHG